MFKNILLSASILALLAASSPLMAMDDNIESLHMTTAKKFAKKIDEVLQSDVPISVLEPYLKFPPKALSAISQHISQRSFDILWDQRNGNIGLTQFLYASMDSIKITKKGPQFAIELFRKGKKFELVSDSVEKIPFKNVLIELNTDWTEHDLKNLSVSGVKKLKIETNFGGSVTENQQTTLSKLTLLFPGKLENEVVLWPSLTSLDCTHLYMRENGKPFATILSECTGLRDLKELNLWGTNMGIEGIEVLAKSENFKSVRKLNLGSCFYQGDLSIIANSDTFAKVIELNLALNGIDDDRADIIANGQFNLQKLSLCNNQIGDTGAEALSKGKATKNITHLNLGSNPIGDQGVISISEAPFMKKLEKVMFGFSPEKITEVGINAIKSNGKNLKIFEYTYKYPENLDDYSF